MPELPDLTVFAKNLKPLVLGQAIEEAHLFTGAKCNLSGDTLAKRARGFWIEEIQRRGKELVFSLSNSHAFAVHLMLAGTIHLEEEAALEEVKGKTLSLALAEGKTLLFADQMRMLKITWNPKPAQAPDALSDGLSLEYFMQAAQKHAWKTAKEFLIDQSIILGIGNAYADEILWRANIAPHSRCGRMPAHALEALHKAIPETLLWAIDSIQALDPARISGEDRSFLAVHQKLRDTAPDGEPILKKQIGKKSTYYTAKQVAYL